MRIQQMTDTEAKRREAICEIANINDIGDLSDGFHTFNQLYYQRMMLFATIVKQNRDRAWKSLRHKDGELCFGGGWFIVGIDTPEGSYTYHYEDNYYSLFDVAMTGITAYSKVPLRIATFGGIVIGLISFLIAS